MKKNKNTLMSIFLTFMALISCEEEISDNPFVGKWDVVKTEEGYNYTSNGDSSLYVSSEPFEFKLTLNADGTGTMRSGNRSDISWYYKKSTNHLHVFWESPFSIENGSVNSNQTRIFKVESNQPESQIWRQTSFKTGEINQDTVYVGYITWELERD